MSRFFSERGNPGGWWVHEVDSGTGAPVSRWRREKSSLKMAEGMTLQMSPNDSALNDFAKQDGGTMKDGRIMTGRIIFQKVHSAFETIA